ncbi:MAG: hypothetical protein LBC07_01515 [Elusimicrobiota bacterium]|jgi:hypothetical protein|nr:hypothetical protein [Elusimicrobiota bacterium]
MPYRDNTYIPPTFEEMLEIVIAKWNSEFGTTYDLNTFQGTNAYRFAYVFIQTQLEQNAAIADIYAKLANYFENINAVIKTPTTTNSGIIDAFADKGYSVAVRDNTILQAGHIGIAVDIDPYATDYEQKKHEILTIIKDNTVAGIFCDGAQEGELQLSNGQVKTFRFEIVEKIETDLQITVTYARGSNYARETADEVKTKLLLNLKNLYGTGQDFAPEKYFEISRDAPYSQNIELEYRNEKTANQWVKTIYYSEYYELFIFEASRITVYFNE